LLKVAGALVRAGAKLEVEDSDGKTVFEKVNRPSLKYLVSHIYFPPTFISEKERTECMLCLKKFGFGRRKYNCTLCGRLCCADDASLFIPFVQFPQGFPGRIHKGAGVLDDKRCCKTCFNVLKGRANAAPKADKGFIARVIGIEWDEVNPDKLQAIHLLLPLHQILVPLQPMRVLVMSLATSVACESHVTVDLTYILISISVVAMIVMALVYVARRVEGANYLHRQRNESTADTVIALATPKSPDW
ncbi:hypothetical protein DYB31_014393, partial [Aphanomyces astaci]